jgi:hypothetical protein
MPLSDALKTQIAQRLVALAHENVTEGGRPFACIVAHSDTGEILAEAANKVIRERESAPTPPSLLNVSLLDRSLMPMGERRGREETETEERA